jgi:hypothetical protein
LHPSEDANPIKHIDDLTYCCLALFQAEEITPLPEWPDYTSLLTVRYQAGPNMHEPVLEPGEEAVEYKGTRCGTSGMSGTF